MKPFWTAPICLLLLVAMSLSGCETPGEGAKHGAIAGAIIGAIAGGNIRSAAIGAAIGAASGALAGKIAEDERRDSYYDEYGHRYPVAQRTDTYGYVISPYRPHNLIDVRGIPHGAHVIDPSCDRVFINP